MKFKIGDIVRAKNYEFKGVVGIVVESPTVLCDVLVDFHPHPGGHDGNGFCKNGWWYDEGDLEPAGATLIDMILKKYGNEM